MVEHHFSLNKFLDSNILNKVNLCWKTFILQHAYPAQTKLEKKKYNTSMTCQLIKKKFILLKMYMFAMINKYEQKSTF